MERMGKLNAQAGEKTGIQPKAEIYLDQDEPRREAETPDENLRRDSGTHPQTSNHEYNPTAGHRLTSPMPQHTVVIEASRSTANSTNHIRQIYGESEVHGFEARGISDLPAGHTPNESLEASRGGINVGARDLQQATFLHSGQTLPESNSNTTQMRANIRPRDFGNEGNVALPNTPQNANNHVTYLQRHTLNDNTHMNNINHPTTERRETQYRQNNKKGINNKTTSATLRIGTLNMRGGGSVASRDKWEHINQIIRDKKIGILALQETHITEKDIEYLEKKYTRLKIINSSDPAHPNAKGVAIVINKYKLPWKEASHIEIEQGRALILTIPWHRKSKINILTVYAPNDYNENETFWKSIEDTWNNNTLPIPDMMLGDMNMVEDAIDRLPARRDPENVSKSMASLKESMNLKDGWRTTHPDTIAYSFTQAQNTSPPRSRIDRILVTPATLEMSRNWSIDHTAIKTDHRLVTVEIADVDAPGIGRGHWTLPLYTLKNRKLMKEIKN